jgi:hypothetical protein
MLQNRLVTEELIHDGHNYAGWDINIYFQSPIFQLVYLFLFRCSGIFAPLIAGGGGRDAI